MQPKKPYSPTRKHWTRLTIRKYGSENSYSLLFMDRAQDSAHHRSTMFSPSYPVLVTHRICFFFRCRCSVTMQRELRASRRDTPHAPRPNYTPQPSHFQQLTRSTTINPITTNIHTPTMPPVTTLLPILLLLLFCSLFGYVGYQVCFHFSLLPPR